MQKLQALITSFGLKENLRSKQIVDSVEKWIEHSLPEDSTLPTNITLHDDGDFLRSFLTLHNCEIYPVAINNPFCYAVKSWFWLTDGGHTAVLDSKAIAGSGEIPENCPDPTASTSYGVGELLVEALNAGCTKIIIICGDSGACDGGAGMLQALGARLLDAAGEDILTIGGGAELSRLSSIDMSSIHPMLRNQENTYIEAVCSSMDVLCGPEGVALADGPQSRASMEQIENLTLALERFSEITGYILRENVGFKPGSGVSGGLGTGLMLLRAQFRTVGDAASEYLDREVFSPDCESLLS